MWVTARETKGRKVLFSPGGKYVTACIWGNTTQLNTTKDELQSMQTQSTSEHSHQDAGAPEGMHLAALQGMMGREGADRSDVENEALPGNCKA